MRISNNVIALNTHRAYTRNNDNVQASAEKLSSGYRINRAGDDAAGLAISEKMRSQIRGLNMATRNSQDAVSLIQTAEGALQEVHSMLQRMNELAVQSATGTNEAFDRTQIAKEFEQLKSEINDISDQTTFNNMRILDGSLSYGGIVRSTYTSGIRATFEQQNPLGGAGGLSGKTMTEGTAFVKGRKAIYEMTFTNDEISLPATGSVFIPKGELKLKITDAKGNSQTLTNDITGIGPGSTAGDIIREYSNKNVTFGTDIYVVIQPDHNKNPKIQLQTQEGKSVPDEFFKGLTFEFQAPASSGFVGGGVKYGDPKMIQAGIDDKPATIAKSTFNFNAENVKSGDQLIIGGKTFTFYNSREDDEDVVAQHKDTSATTSIDLAVVNSASALQEQLQANYDLANVAADTLKFTASGETIEIEYAGNAGTDEKEGKTGDVLNKGAYGTAGNDYVKVDFNADARNAFTGVTTFEVDPAKLKPGDKLTYLTDGKKKVTYEYKSGDTAKDIMDAFGIKEADRDGNTWKVKNAKDQTSRLEFEAAADFKTYAPLKIQVGALQGDQLDIKIEAMNTAGLKLDGESIYLQGNAGSAVTATRNAINAVSEQRALLGAMQNRIGHKIANLKVSVENLQASESRIRDLDIASEMTAFTKNNILAQAATSMLSQANSGPQNVLALLR